MSLQRYPKVQIIYFAHRAITLWVVRISTQCTEEASHCSGRATSTKYTDLYSTLVAGAWTEREKMYHGGSFLKLADDNMDIQNPEAQNRDISGF